MRAICKLLKWLVIVLVMAVTGAIGWLSLMPPELFRIGTGYAAKIVCSNVFLAGRDPREVLAVDVQAPGHPLLRLVDVEVDRTEKRVRAGLLRVFAPSVAVYREGYGCTSLGDGSTVASDLPPTQPNTAGSMADWPVGNGPAMADSRIAAILGEPVLTGPGLRGVVVVKEGRIVGEAYGAGFSAATPLLGWSMTKTVNAAILGRRMLEGGPSFNDTGLLPQWKDSAQGTVRLKDLLAMESGLEFNENYGDVADVTRMLFLEPDMARFAADKPLEATPGSRFNYSSGTSVLLSRIWMNSFADGSEALRYPREKLFAPLGMTSAVMEPDAAGTFAGSSYLYASARDWARFGEFLLRDGVWNGARLLPEGFAAGMAEPSAASNGAYTRIQAWHAAPGSPVNEEGGLPNDMFWLQGHDGQSAAILPSEKLVVVRLGLTPSKLGYRPLPLVRALADALR